MNKKLHTECPGYEDISAYFDGELDVDSPEYSHIKECKYCQSELKAYGMIDTSIKSEFSDAVPDDFAENLIISIRAREKSDVCTDPLPFRKFLRVAALFLVCGIVLYSLIPRNRSQITPSLNPTIAKPIVFLDKDIPSGGFNDYRFKPSRKYAAGTHNVIDMGKFMHVSTTAYPEKESFPDTTSTGDPSAIIKPIVNQTWSVDNLHNARNELVKISDPSNLETDKNGNLVAKFNLTKKELAELVREYETAGFRLISPSQPQPEQTTFAGHPKDKVLYTATFVEPE